MQLEERQPWNFGTKKIKNAAIFEFKFLFKHQLPPKFSGTFSEFLLITSILYFSE